MVKHTLMTSLRSTAKYTRSIIMQESNGDVGEAHDVYNTTTEPEIKSTQCFVVPTAILSRRRCLIKVVEVFLAFLAFVLEEIVTSCEVCMPLYFFEFASCSAFLFTLLLLILLSTVLHTKVKMTINDWAKVDFVYTIYQAVLFLCSSMAFAIQNDGSLIEKAAATFGILSSLVFFLDFVVLVRTQAFPFKKSDKTSQDDGEAAAPEEQHLNALPNGNAPE